MTARQDANALVKTARIAGQGTRVFTTVELFGDQEEIVLLHKGAPYRLRVTRQDKLILTK